jgi:phage internal scaffolding protein
MTTKIVKRREVIMRPNGTKRIKLTLDSKQITDQSDLKASDINNIMRQYAKTGVLPNLKDRVAQYIDNTQIPSYMEALEQIQGAKEMFLELPSNLRKMMDNNPNNLEKFIKDPENEDICLKYGILEKEKPPVIEQVATVPKEVSNPPSQEGAVE